MPLTPARQLVYDFLDLPFHVQMSIGREMEFSPFSEDLHFADTFARWFGEARVRGQIEKLREAVAREKERLSPRA